MTYTKVMCKNELFLFLLNMILVLNLCLGIQCLDMDCTRAVVICNRNVLQILA